MGTKHVKGHQINGSTDSPLYFQSHDKRVKMSSSNANIPSGVQSIRDLEDQLGALAFANDVDIPSATLISEGVVQLSNSIQDSTSPQSQTQAATTKAVSDAYAGSVHMSGNQDVAGTKNFTGGSIQLAGAEISYNQSTNVLTISPPVSNS